MKLSLTMRHAIRRDPVIRTSSTLFFALAAMVASLILPAPAAAADETVAVAILYDTSGSMKDSVKDKSGRLTQKYIIGNRALESVANQLEKFATNSPGRKLQAGLFPFSGNGARVVVPMGPLDAAAIRRWAQQFKSPESGTPIGTALRTAADALNKTGIVRKHILIITDGENTVGPAPASVWPQIQQANHGAPVIAHFVAFDVDARVFAPMKKLGATVVGAGDEKQLNTQLDFILQKKILLEDEEPPKKN